MTVSIPWDGKMITRPGVYSGMPLDDYHRGDICDGPSISSSGERLMWNKSPAHFRATSPLNPNQIEHPASEALNLGRATHHLLQGQVAFAAEFAVRPEEIEGEAWNGNKKICKAWLAKQAHARKTVLLPAQVEAIRGMAERLGAFPLFQEGILSGAVERSIFALDDETGVWKKARPDAIPNDSGDFADLKTTQSVLYRDLVRTIDDFGYQQQGAMVMECAREVGIEASSFSLVFVEKTKPHCVRAVVLKDDDLARGAKMNRAMLRLFARCYESGNWPGPGDDRADAEYIELSDRARTLIDDRLKTEFNL